VAEWIVMPPADQRAFPEVRHRHPNGMMIAVRDHTPEVAQELRNAPLLRWSYRCP
jgi:hypothetical protein